MRWVRTCLAAVALMLPCQSAHADTQRKCAASAANFSDASVTGVDAWLTRYLELYAVCRSQDKTTKSANKKAVFKGMGLRPIPMLGEYPSPDVPKSERTPSKPVQKPGKRAKPKTTKKVGALQVRTPLKAPTPASKSTRSQKYTRSIGAESWRINCSARFGGFDKNSEWYISSSGKRVSCVIREKP